MSQHFHLPAFTQKKSIYCPVRTCIRILGEASVLMAPNSKEPKCPPRTVERLNKMCVYTYMAFYICTIGKHTLLLLIAEQMHLADILLNETCQPQKNKCHLIALLWGARTAKLRVTEVRPGFLWDHAS